MGTKIIDKLPRFVIILRYVIVFWTTVRITDPNPVKTVFMPGFDLVFYIAFQRKVNK